MRLVSCQEAAAREEKQRLKVPPSPSSRRSSPLLLSLTPAPFPLFDVVQERVLQINTLVESENAALAPIEYVHNRPLDGGDDGGGGGGGGGVGGRGRGAPGGGRGPPPPQHHQQQHSSSGSSSSSGGGGGGGRGGGGGGRFYSGLVSGGDRQLPTGTLDLDGFLKVGILRCRH